MDHDSPLVSTDKLPGPLGVRGTKLTPREVLLPTVLFVLTFVTTSVGGFFFHVNFVSQSADEMVRRVYAVLNNPANLLDGLPFSLTILLILLAHEMGHYLTCRYYGISATLPHMIPAPPPLLLFGTFGAVIRIRSMFRDRKQLFDVGIAGPLAGFFFIVPAVILGVSYSVEFRLPNEVESTYVFGEPLLFQWVAQLFFEGDNGLGINLHPIGWAAWFGMLATSLNLLPIGQLDGGHILYALAGEKMHRKVSYLVFFGLVGLGAYSMVFYSWQTAGYLLFALILLVLRLRHPRPFYDLPIVGPGRYFIALVGLVVLILCFIPVPVKLVEHVGSL